MNQESQMRFWCNNKSSISIANKPLQHDRTKHIKIDRFFIKESLDSEILKLIHVSTLDQVVDYLTKGLGPISFSLLCDKMSLEDIFLHLGGGVLRMIKVVAQWLAIPNNKLDQRPYLGLYKEEPSPPYV